MQHNVYLKGKTIIVEQLKTIDKKVLPYSIDFYPENYNKRVIVKETIYYRNLRKINSKIVLNLFAKFKTDINKIGLDDAIDNINKSILDAKLNRVTLLPEDVGEIILRLKDQDKLSHNEIGDYLSINYGLAYSDSYIKTLYKQAKRGEKNVCKKDIK